MKKLYFVVYETNGLNQNTKYKERIEQYALSGSVEEVIAGIRAAHEAGGYTVTFQQIVEKSDKVFIT